MVLVSLSEWNSIQETLHLLSSPRNAERLLAAIADFERGEPGIEVDPETLQPIKK
jgi:antitoxin YefM